MTTQRESPFVLQSLVKWPKRKEYKVEVGNTFKNV